MRRTSGDWLSELGAAGSSGVVTKRKEMERIVVACELQQRGWMALARISATPMHSARITRRASVSSPVWRVWSQRSNASKTGQPKQAIKMTTTAVWINVRRMGGMPSLTYEGCQAESNVGEGLRREPVSREILRIGLTCGFRRGSAGAPFRGALRRRRPGTTGSRRGADRTRLRQATQLDVLLLLLGWGDFHRRCL